MPLLLLLTLDVAFETYFRIINLLLVTVLLTELIENLGEAKLVPPVAV